MFTINLSDEEKELLPPPAAAALPPTTYLLHPGRRRPIRRDREKEDDSEDESTMSGESDESESEDEEEEDQKRRRPTARPRRSYERWVIAFVVFLIVFVAGGWAAKTYIDRTASGEAEVASPTTTKPSVETEAPKVTAAPASSNADVGIDSSPSTKASSAKKTDASPSKTASSAASSSTGTTSTGSGAGMFGVTDDVCGDSGAVDEPGPGVGPNGAQTWLNCGLSSDDRSSPWTPPKIDIASLKYLDLAEAVKLDTFSACTKWVDLFNSLGEATGLPPIFLASIALTESSCNGDAVAPGNASWGLMQITTEKCTEAPGGDCNDPDFNVNKGASYFNSVLSDSGGISHSCWSSKPSPRSSATAFPLRADLFSSLHSFLVALAQYNGWPSDMTWDYATQYASSDCVRQNNLDYLQSNLNGWMQGVDGNSVRTIKNLDSCG